MEKMVEIARFTRPSDAYALAALIFAYPLLGLNN